MGDSLDDAGVNRPEVVAEVRAAFDAYERALVTHDLDDLDDAFWNDDRVIRFGIADGQRGPDELARFRSTSGPVAPGRVLHDTAITTFGDDFATAWTRFTDTHGGIGRQSQVWARIDGRWQIVAAHVSRVAGEFDSH